MLSANLKLPDRLDSHPASLKAPRSKVCMRPRSARVRGLISPGVGLGSVYIYIYIYIYINTYTHCYIAIVLWD